MERRALGSSRKSYVVWLESAPTNHKSDPHVLFAHVIMKPPLLFWEWTCFHGFNKAHRLINCIVRSKEFCNLTKPSSIAHDMAPATATELLCHSTGPLLLILEEMDLVLAAILPVECQPLGPTDETNKRPGACPVEKRRGPQPWRIHIPKDALVGIAEPGSNNLKHDLHLLYISMNTTMSAICLRPAKQWKACFTVACSLPHATVLFTKGWTLKETLVQYRLKLHAVCQVQDHVKLL